MLKQLNANVNFSSEKIETPDVKIPIIFEEKQISNSSNFQNNSIIIPGRTQQIIKLPVTLRNGIGILNYIHFGKNLESPKALVNVSNYYAITSITNSNETDIKLNFHEPFDIEPINIFDVNFVERMETDQDLTQYHDDLLKENLKNIRLDSTARFGVAVG